VVQYKFWEANMQRKETWYDCVRSVIDALLTASDTAAREVGKVWQWAFSELEKSPKNFNLLQNTSPENLEKLVEEFLRTCERRARGETISDRSLVELTLDSSLSLNEVPANQQISKEVADALAAFGMFLGHAGHNAIDSPSRFPYATALFGLHDKVLADIIESKRIPEEQRKILLSVASFIPRGGVQKEYFRRVEAAAKIEKLFGFSIRLLSPTDVYQRGFEFYKIASRIEESITLTFSNTSGLWNPHERLGSAEFVRRYGRKPGADFKFKDGFRSTNFTDGILNDSLVCRRIYFFNEEDTWNALRSSRNAAENVAAFDEDAKLFAEEVCKRIEASTGKLYLVAVKNWSKFPPLALVSRVSHETLMFSNRGSDLSISHAFWCSLTREGHQKERRVRYIEKILYKVADLASGGVLSTLESLSPFLQDIYGRIELMAAERMRRILDEEPGMVITHLEDQFGIEVESITSQILRDRLDHALQSSQDNGI